MALQGTLQDFGALETFQLIALQTKTGTLEITQAGRRRCFVFENGQLLAAHESPLKAEDPLVRFLLETGTLREEDLPAWLGFPASQPVNPIDLLAKMGRVSADDLVLAYDLFLQTVFDEILSWPEGRFQFHTGRLDTPSKTVGPWKLEAVLMESMRRLDELADLQAVEMPPGLVPRVSDPAAAALIEEPFARAVLRRIDGRRTLQEICQGLYLAGYDLYQALRQLREQGLVEMTEWVPSGPWMESFWQKRSWGRMVLCALGAPAALVGLTFGIQTALLEHPGPWPTAREGGFLTEEVRASRDTYGMALLLEAYRLHHGAYAADYEPLVEERLLGRRAADRLATRGLTWTLSADGRGYRWSPSAAASTASIAAARSDTMRVAGGN